LLLGVGGRALGRLLGRSRLVSLGLGLVVGLVVGLLVGLVRLLRGALLGDGLGLLLAAGLLERLVEEVELGLLHLGGPQGALGAGEPLELLPVASDLEQRRDGLGRLG